MRDDFLFRLSPEISWDGNIGRRPLLILILASALQSSACAPATNEAKAHRLGFFKLTAGGLSDSMILSAVETRDNTFDVSPASAVHILLSVRSIRRHRSFIAGFEGRAVEILGGAPKSLVGEKWKLLSATISLRSRPFVQPQATLREPEVTRSDPDKPKRSTRGVFGK